MPKVTPSSALPKADNTISKLMNTQFNFQPQSLFLCSPIKTKIIRMANIAVTAMKMTRAISSIGNCKYAPVEIIVNIKTSGSRK